MPPPGQLGGWSRLASAAHLALSLAADPQLARVLQELFYFDACGQQLPGNRAPNACR